MSTRPSSSSRPKLSIGAELGKALTLATAEAKDFLRQYHADTLRIPEDVKELMRLVKQYHKEALLYQYRGLLFIEQIYVLQDANIRLSFSDLVALYMQIE